MQDNFNNSRNSGMTLIELMIVIVIVAILASVAVPTYRGYSLRAHRAEAKAALFNMAAAQEKFYLQNNTYTDKLTDAPPAGLGMTATTESGYYDLKIESANADHFKLSAEAVGDQADDTHCAKFFLEDGGSKSATSEDCWRR